MRVLLIFFVAFLTGCASTTGVISIGGNAFMVSRSEKGFDTTGSRVKAVAIKEADAFCILSGKALEIIKSTQKDMVPFTSDAQAEVEFRCISNR